MPHQTPRVALIPAECFNCGHRMETHTDGSERCARQGCGFVVTPAIVRTAEALAHIEMRRAAKRAYDVLPVAAPLPNAPSPTNLGGRPTPSSAELVIVGATLLVLLAGFLGGAIAGLVLPH